MSRFFQTRLGRGYSYDELVTKSDEFMRNPKFPPGYAEAMSKLDGKRQSFVRYTQDVYTLYLKEIASRQSLKGQREELLRLVLQEAPWHAVFRAANKATYNQSWGHFTKGAGWFEDQPTQPPKLLLTARYLLALTCMSWLQVVGKYHYGLSDATVAALDLYIDYDAGIKEIDVNMFELMFAKLDGFEDGEGMAIGKVKDDVVNPIIKEQYAILDRLGKDIVNDTLDVDFYQSEFSRIDAIKQHVAHTIMAMSSE